MAVDIYLRPVPSDANAADVRLRDPAAADAGGSLNVDVAPATLTLVAATPGVDAAVDIAPATLALAGATPGVVAFVDVAPAVLTLVAVDPIVETQGAAQAQPAAAPGGCFAPRRRQNVFEIDMVPAVLRLVAVSPRIEVVAAPVPAPTYRDGARLARVAYLEDRRRAREAFIEQRRADGRIVSERRRLIEIAESLGVEVDAVLVAAIDEEVQRRARRRAGRK